MTLAHENEQKYRDTELETRQVFGDRSNTRNTHCLHQKPSALLDVVDSFDQLNTLWQSNRDINFDHWIFGAPYTM